MKKQKRPKIVFGHNPFVVNLVPTESRLRVSEMAQVYRTDMELAISQELEANCLMFAMLQVEKRINGHVSVPETEIFEIMVKDFVHRQS